MLVASNCLLSKLEASGKSGTTSGASNSTSGRPRVLAEFGPAIKSLDRKNYAESKVRQQTPKQVGSAQMEYPPIVPGQSVIRSESNNEQFVHLERPELRALVSVNRNVSPFGLDSTCQERVTLREVLLAVSGANLDILQSASNLQSRKWLYLNSFTEYLPAINLGFNEIGLNSTVDIPIKTIANVPSQAGIAGASGAVSAIASQTAIKTPLTILNSGFTWKPFQGGKLIFGVMAERHSLRAARAQLKSDISDVLLSTTNDYYDLLFNEASLEIRTAATETSQEQVRQNTSLESGGLATNLDILQSKTQLSKDRQNLLEQQRLRRAAAMKLAHDLNLNLGQDLLPAEDTLRSVRLISEDLSVAELLKIAIDNRPELKRYEELRLAAKKQIGVVSSELLPAASLGGNIIGIQSSIGRLSPTYLLNFALSWKFDGLGTKALTNIEATRWQARQAMLEANKQFLDVVDQVRNAYNSTLTTEQAIDESSNEVASAQEELRLARMRLDNGLGTNLDVLTAQRDLTQARLDKALALMNFNKAQAKLLHDIGLISIENLSAGLVLSPRK